MRSAKWMGIVLVGTMMLLCILAIPTIVVDPYFHFHAPLEQLEYPIHNQRYQNNGIERNFKYDAIITGTSMTEKFLTSEFDTLFDVNSVKVCFSGGSFKEINDNLEKALEYNSDIKMIVRGLDMNFFALDKDVMRYDSYPDYLYDDFILNDVSYVWNKTVLAEETWRVIKYTQRGNKTTTFDEYSNYFENAEVTVAEQNLLKDKKRQNPAETVELSDEEKNIIRENVTQNIVELAKANPQVEFYLFFTPYSILWWDEADQKGKVKMEVEVQKEVIELLLPYENIKLFSFCNNFDLVSDLNKYTDSLHYCRAINSEMLKWMKNEEYRLTEDNYCDYLQEIQDYYTTYDYEALYMQ